MHPVPIRSDSLPFPFLDRGQIPTQRAVVAETESSPMDKTLRWLTAHGCYPAGRLPAGAELLLLFAAAAGAEEISPRNDHHRMVIPNANFAAEMRRYTAQRRRAHINSDNSAKT